jgi:hypothetical protein
MIFEYPAYEEARVRAHELFGGIPGAEDEIQLETICMKPHSLKSPS